MAENPEHLVAGALRPDPQDVVEVEVDLFMILVEVRARGVREAVVLAQDQRHAAGARAGAGGGVEEVQDVLDLEGEVFACFDVGEEDGGAFVAEVVEVQADFGGGEVVGADWRRGGGGGVAGRVVGAGDGGHGLLEVGGGDWHGGVRRGVYVGR